MTSDQIIFFRMNQTEEFLEFQQLLQSSGITCSIQFLKGEIDPKCDIDPETSSNEGQEDLANVKTRLLENCSIQFLPGEIETKENVSLAASRADIKREFSEVKFDARKEESCSVQFLPGELESNEIFRTDDRPDENLPQEKSTTIKVRPCSVKLYQLNLNDQVNQQDNTQSELLPVESGKNLWADDELDARVESFLDKLGNAEEIENKKLPQKISDTFPKIGDVKNESLIEVQINEFKSIKAYKCHECEKIFAALSTLKRHKETHSKERPFKCSKCENTYKCFFTMKRHEIVHSDEKAFKCTECDKAFHLKHHLVDHFRMHTNEKPFGCNQCDKTFARDSHRVRHQKTHVGEKPFICRHCDKKFSRPGHLKEHEKRHTSKELWEFSCSRCGRKFATKSDKQIHEKKFTNCNESYDCRYCYKTYPGLSRLKNHEKTHTKGGKTNLKKWKPII